MNGLRTSLRHCRRPYGIVRKDNHVSGPFFNFSRRHCLRIESLAAPTARCGSDGDNYPPKGRKPVRGAKESFPGAKRTARASNGIKDGGGESIPPAGDSDENRRKSVCAFAFGVRKRLRCLRAVGPRPDSNDFRMRPYAPYAVPLKGKRPEKVQLPKEAHKVHTASLMLAQPYPSLAFRLWRKSA